MTFKKYILAIAVLAFISLQSCKKDNAPDPTPAPPKPDTLTNGWTKKVFASHTNFSDIFFNTPTTGYVMGDSLFKSTDGGNSWIPLTHGPETNLFITPDGKVFFVGFNNNIYKTIDGGTSFLSSFVQSQATDIFFIDNSTGYCITQNDIYTTTDGGIMWTRIMTTGLPSFTSYGTLSCVNNTSGCVASEKGIFKTNGSFASWQQSVINGGNTSTAFSSLFATSTSNIYATNFYSELFKSSDGGATFNFLSRLTSETGFADIHFLSDLAGYACTGRFILKTTDGGLNWSKVVSLGEGAFSELHFTDLNHGWACGANGIVLTYKQ